MFTFISCSLLRVCIAAGQIKNSDVMLERKTGDVMYCTLQPWTSLWQVCMDFILCFYGCQCTKQQQQKTTYGCLLRMLYKRTAIWRLQAQTSPCTFPLQWVEATPPSKPLSPPVSLSSLLACYQARYSSQAVPLFLIGWLGENGRGLVQGLYKHCCGGKETAELDSCWKNGKEEWTVEVSRQ